MHGTYTCLIHRVNYHEQQRLALCEGVLETYPTDTSVLSPFPEYRSRGTGDFLRAEYRPRANTWNMMGCPSTHQANPNCSRAILDSS